MPKKGRVLSPPILVLIMIKISDQGNVFLFNNFNLGIFKTYFKGLKKELILKRTAIYNENHDLFKFTPPLRQTANRTKMYLASTTRNVRYWEPLPLKNLGNVNETPICDVVPKNSDCYVRMLRQWIVGNKPMTQQEDHVFSQAILLVDSEGKGRITEYVVWFVNFEPYYRDLSMKMPEELGVDGGGGTAQIKQDNGNNSFPGLNSSLASLVANNNNNNNSEPEQSFNGALASLLNGLTEKNNSNANINNNELLPTDIIKMSQHQPHFTQNFQNENSNQANSMPIKEHSIEFLKALKDLNPEDRQNRNSNHNSHNNGAAKNSLTAYGRGSTSKIIGENHPNFHQFQRVQQQQQQMSNFQSVFQNQKHQEQQQQNSLPSLANNFEFLQKTLLEDHQVKLDRSNENSLPTLNNENDSDNNNLKRKFYENNNDQNQSSSSLLTDMIKALTRNQNTENVNLQNDDDGHGHGEKQTNYIEDLNSLLEKESNNNNNENSKPPEVKRLKTDCEPDIINVLGNESSEISGSTTSNANTNVKENINTTLDNSALTSNNLNTGLPSSPNDSGTTTNNYSGISPRDNNANNSDSLGVGNSNNNDQSISLSESASPPNGLGPQNGLTDAEHQKLMAFKHSAQMQKLREMNRTNDKIRSNAVQNIVKIPNNNNNINTNTNTPFSQSQIRQILSNPIVQQALINKEKEIQKLRAKLHVQIEHARNSGVPRLDRDIFQKRVGAFLDREDEFSF